MNNNPLRYTDPSGHCSPLCSGLLGAGAGFLVDLGKQVLWEGKRELDYARLAGATVGGLVFGATMGKAPANLSWWQRGLWAAGAGVLGGQSGRATEAVFEDIARLRNGEGMDAALFFKGMADKGVLKLESIAVDATTGVVSAATGKVVHDFFKAIGWIRTPGASQHTTLLTYAWDVGTKQATFNASGGKIIAPVSDSELFLDLLAQGFFMQAEELLAESLSKGLWEWIPDPPKDPTQDQLDPTQDPLQ